MSQMLKEVTAGALGPSLKGDQNGRSVFADLCETGRQVPRSSSKALLWGKPKQSQRVVHYWGRCPRAPSRGTRYGTLDGRDQHAHPSMARAQGWGVPEKYSKPRAASCPTQTLPTCTSWQAHDHSGNSENLARESLPTVPQEEQNRAC